MKNKRSTRNIARAQQGYVMLALMAILGIAAITVYVSSLNATTIHNDQARKTNAALAIAKQALIASAASNVNHPGALPCPDIDNDGLRDLAAGGVGACTALFGRLPWKTLGLPDVRDAGGERLWYMLSANFQDISAIPINSDTGGQISISGTITANGIVAVLFAPGSAIGAQTRELAHVNSPAFYLESYTGGVITTRAQDNTYNDELAMLTPADVFSVVEKRIAQEVQYALKNYYALSANQFPYPALATACNPGSCVADTTAPLQNGALSGRIPAHPTPGDPASTYPTGGVGPPSVLGAGTWFDLNGWRNKFNYRVDPNCVVVSASCGTLTSSYSNALPYGDSPYSVTGVKGVLQFTVLNSGTASESVRMFYARGLN